MAGNAFFTSCCNLFHFLYFSIASYDTKFFLPSFLSKTMMSMLASLIFTIFEKTRFFSRKVGFGTL